MSIVMKQENIANNDRIWNEIGGIKNIPWQALSYTNTLLDALTLVGNLLSAGANINNGLSPLCKAVNPKEKIFIQKLKEFLSTLL